MNDEQSTQCIATTSDADEAGPPHAPQAPSTGLYALSRTLIKSLEGLDELELALSRSSISGPPTSTHSAHETFGQGAIHQTTTLESPKPRTSSEPANGKTRVGKKRSRDSDDDGTPDEVHTPKSRRTAPTPVPSMRLLAEFYAIDQAREAVRSAQRTGNTPSTAPSAALSDVP